MGRHPEGNGSHGDVEVLEKYIQRDGDAPCASRLGTPLTSSVFLRSRAFLGNVQNEHRNFYDH